MDTEPFDARVLELLRFTKSHDCHLEALARATGEHFNIFHILGVGHLEVTTHSPILAELLNPCGNHGQGAAFLRLFLVQFGIGDLETDTATVRTEYHAGPLTEKSGGRMDIMVRDGKGTAILIENKIHAGDQDNQMARYRAFDHNAHLFYLTLDGREPTNLTKSQVAGIRCISYASDVLAWLLECRKEATALPGVRETLSQYIHLIEELTEQSTTSRMNQELINAIIQDGPSLSAFYTLRNAESAVQEALIAKLDIDITASATAAKLVRVGPIVQLRNKGGNFSFTTATLRAHNLQIRFEFGSRGYHGFYFGFCLLDDNRVCSISGEITSEYRKLFDLSTELPRWPAWTWWPEYRDWELPTFEAIRNGSFRNDLTDKLVQLAGIASAVCPAESMPLP